MIEGKFKKHRGAAIVSGAHKAFNRRRKALTQAVVTHQYRTQFLA